MLPPRPDDPNASSVVVATPPALEDLQPMTAAAAAAQVGTEGLLAPQDLLLPEHRPTVVLVDPLSTGVLLQQRVFALGYQVILVWSERSQPASHVRHFERSGHGKEDFAAIICHEHDEQLPDPVSSFDELSAPTWWKQQQTESR